MAIRGFDTPIALDRDTFMRRLIASLGHLNEGILGADIAGAYIMNVGLSMGAAIEAEYKSFWGITRPFTVDEYAHVIIDLKQKIRGNFSLVSQDTETVVVRTTSCPFDDFVRQSPSLCFMTSSVFGGIAARNFGYSKVALHRRIALGDDGCLVTVYLRRTPEAEQAVGREYFPDQDKASPDIAEQLRLMENVRRLRRELVETSARWEEVVRGAADALCIIDLAGNVAFANARWRELLGVEGDELVGGTFERVVHPDDQAVLGQVRTRVLQGQRVVGQEIRLLHRDTTWRDGIVSLGPLRDDDGRVMGALGIVRDVTDEREAARLKDRLLSTTSHELRTPVATIKGLTQLLLRTLEQRGQVDPEQLVKRLQVIEREAERLALLGSDLVDVTAFQAGRLALSTKGEDLREIIQACVEAQRVSLRDAAPHRLLVDLPAEPLRVEVQSARVEQVVANLLENAIKYSPDGGDVRIQAGCDQTSAWVTVSDDGIGIPAAEVDSVFTPFFRASNASVQNFGGLGLGLYLAKLIAQAHGGDLTLVSAEGQGSSFTLTLPSAAASEVP